MKTYSFKIFTGIATLLFFSGCAHYHVEVNHNEVDAPLPSVSGVDTAQAQSASKKSILGLWDVYDLAVERTETLASQAENLEQADAQQAQALGAWLPQVNLSGQKNWVSGSYTQSSLGGILPNSGQGDSLYLSGAETILSGLNQVAAIQGAQSNIDAQKFALRNSASRLLLNVAQAFYSVLELQDALKTDQASRALTEKILGVQKHWVAIGRAQKSDMLNTTAQLAQLDAAFQSDNTQLTQSRENLAFLAGIPPDTVLQSTDDNPSDPNFSLDQALSNVDNRPDVREAKANLDVA
ncbi:MAG: TolC family protein, partial [bacterium]